MSLQGIGGAGQLSLIGACLHLDNHAGPSFAPGADSFARPSFLLHCGTLSGFMNQVESTSSGHPGTLDVCQKYKKLELTAEKESTGVREQHQSTNLVAQRNGELHGFRSTANLLLFCTLAWMECGKERAEKV